jgi:hypothetical protein
VFSAASQRARRKRSVSSSSLPPEARWWASSMMITSQRLAESSRKAGAIAALDEIHGGDDAGLGGPRIRAGFERAARLGDAFAVEDLELEAELGGQFGLPLLDDRRRADDQDARGAAAGIEFAQDEAGFDGLAEADIVGDQQARARQFECPECRDLLVRFEFDAGAGGGDEPVVTGSQAEPDGVHQKLEAREPPGAGQVELGDLIRLYLFDRVQDADLFIAKGLIKRTQSQPANGIAARLGDSVGAKDEESPPARPHGRACLEFGHHG